VRFGASKTPPWLGGARSSAHRRCSIPSPPLVRRGRFVRARPRVTGVATPARRGRDAFDRLLHSETVSLEHPWLSSLSQRSSLRGGFRRRERSLSSRCLSAPCSSTRTSGQASFRVLVSLRSPRFSPGEAKKSCVGKLGAARRKRGWGEMRFTARFSLRRSDLRASGRCLPSCESIRSPLALVSPPPSRLVRARERDPRPSTKAAKTGSAGAS